MTQSVRIGNDCAGVLSMSPIFFNENNLIIPNVMHTLHNYESYIKSICAAQRSYLQLQVRHVQTSFSH